MKTPPKEPAVRVTATTNNELAVWVDGKLIGTVETHSQVGKLLDKHFAAERGTNR